MLGPCSMLAIVCFNAAPLRRVPEQDVEAAGKWPSKPSCHRKICASVLKQLPTCRFPTRHNHRVEKWDARRWMSADRFKFRRRGMSVWNDYRKEYSIVSKNQRRGKKHKWPNMHAAFTKHSYFPARLFDMYPHRSQGLRSVDGCSLNSNP